MGQIQNLSENIEALAKYAQNMYNLYVNKFDLPNSRFFWEVSCELLKYKLFLNDAQSFNEEDCLYEEDCLDELLKNCFEYLYDVDEKILTI